MHGNRDNHVVDTWRRISSNSVSANELKSLRILHLFPEIENWPQIVGTAFSMSTFKFPRAYLTTLCKIKAL